MRIGKMTISEGRRMFGAASDNRLQWSWGTADYTADQVAFAQLDVLRARAREQSRNNDYVVRLIQILQNNVIGASGFKLRSQVIDRKGNPDKNARKAIEARWDEFTFEADLLELFLLAMSALVTDGEVFLYMREINGELRPELIDPALIDVSYNKTIGSNQIIMGIEFDSSMRPVAYHMNETYRAAHPSAGNSNTQKRIRIDADKIVHIFKKLYVGQKRGFPLLASSLSRLFQLGRYEEAALTAARIGAAKMGFFVNGDNDEYEGDEESGAMTMNAEAGTFENIGSLDFKQFDPTYPAGEFQGFMTRTLQGIASGLGIDYHSLGNDLSNVNYSSARVGMLETREYFKTLQAWLIAKLMRPLFRKWLDLEIFFERITVAGRPLNRGLSYYLPSEFVGRRWEWVDPQKEAKAKETQYQMRTISLSQIIRERGDDPEDVFNEIAEENKRLKELGISPEQVISSIGGNDEAEQEDS